LEIISLKEGINWGGYLNWDTVLGTPTYGDLNSLSTGEFSIKGLIHLGL